MTLDNQFGHFLRQNHLLKPEQSVLLAVSGGIDSMVMMHLFHRIQKQWRLRYHVAHINHQLRGDESDGDEVFVRESAKVYGMPFHSSRVDVHKYMHAQKCSKQEAARELRYEAIENIRSRIKADVVATAHQANDNAETILLNIVRGTGIHGLSGIPIRRKNGNVIRPLLFATREEINSYARNNALKYREDSTNSSLVYKRNLLRNKILPRIQQHHPVDIVGLLNQCADILRDVESKLTRLKEKSLSRLAKKENNLLSIDLEQFSQLPTFLKEELIVELLRVSGVQYDSKRIDSILRLSTSQTGKMLTIQKQICIYRDRNRLILQPVSKNTQSAAIIDLNKEYLFTNFSFSTRFMHSHPRIFSHDHLVEYVDASKLGKHLVLRPWKEGDRFIPLGMKTHKKVSDFFADMKIPRFQKTNIPIFESDGNIVWICGKRLDDRFKLTQNSQNIVKLSYQPIN